MESFQNVLGNRGQHGEGPRTLATFWNRFEVPTNMRFNHGSCNVWNTHWQAVVHTEWEHAVLPCFVTVFQCPQYTC